ncbi:MAG: hypothetical protein WBM00_04805 [Solirubrobacterales bacterium]
MTNPDDGSRARVIADYKRVDRLWLVIPCWDEGIGYEAEEGTAQLVIAPSQRVAEESIPKADFVRVFEMPSRGSFD